MARAFKCLRQDGSEFLMVSTRTEPCDRSWLVEQVNALYVDVHKRQDASEYRADIIKSKRCKLR